ncbi:MAG: dihydropteroate synthase [Muribaculaceae bacterium]|nr:dihydropteroate synthase [Muribaculaceae bacterium]
MENCRKGYSLNVGDRLVEFDRPVVMGVLNFTPDSFYAASRHSSSESIIVAAEKMIVDGADILDIGAASSRPGATIIDAETETARAVEAVGAVRQAFPSVLISIDTFRADVAAKAVKAGANIVNDISGGRADKRMFSIVADLHVPIIIQHSRGDSTTMQSLTDYDDVTADVITSLSTSVDAAVDAGVTDIIIDPGFGFAKTSAQSFELLNNLAALKVLGFPILVGLSRKSMICSTLGITPDDALNGTTVLNTIALANGADILRVHDVKEARQAVLLYLETIKSNK